MLFIAGGIATHVCAGEKVKVGSSTLDNVLFVDGFDGSSVVPDTAVWKLCTYAHNAWSQHFKAVDGYENVRVENGYLKLRACKDNGFIKWWGVFQIGFLCDTRLEVKARLTGWFVVDFPQSGKCP